VGEGSYANYHNQPFDRGHLVPGATYSSTADSFLSTYVYSNAVPQRPAFNQHPWKDFEARIRVYAQQCTQAGTLFLITGTAFGHIQNGNPPQMNPVPVNQLGPVAAAHAIAIPNSMWTAGCCVRGPNDVTSFAVIGNNVQDQNQMLTQKISVDDLRQLLEADVFIILNIGAPIVDLFPGNAACSDVNNDLPALPLANGR